MTAMLNADPAVDWTLGVNVTRFVASIDALPAYDTWLCSSVSMNGVQSHADKAPYSSSPALALSCVTCTCSRLPPLPVAPVNPKWT